MGATQLVLLAIGAIAGLAAVGSLRAAQLLLGPVNILTLGFSIAAVPEVSRILGQSVDRFRLACLRIGLLLMVATVAWAVVAMLIPEAAGRALLGASWPGASLVLVPTALFVIGRVGGSAPRIGLVALAAADVTLRVTLVESVVSITAGVVGAALGGAVGAAWGLAFVAAGMALIWWGQFVLVLQGVRVARKALPVEPAGPTSIPEE